MFAVLVVDDDIQVIFDLADEHNLKYHMVEDDILNIPEHTSYWD